MKKTLMMVSMFFVILSLVAMPISNSIAEEINGEESTSYLTFLSAQTATIKFY